MNDLTKIQETILAECFQAMDAGATAEDCLARYPDHEAALRPLLELRSELLQAELPEPSAAAFDAGREALLKRVQDPGAGDRPRGLGHIGRLFGALAERPAPVRFAAPLVRAATALAVVALVGGGILGASAAAGFGPARDALGALHVIDDTPKNDDAGQPPATEEDEAPDQNAHEDADNTHDGIGNAPDAASPGKEQADGRADDGNGDAENQPGALPDPAIDSKQQADEHQPDGAGQSVQPPVPDVPGQPQPNPTLPQDSGGPPPGIAPNNAGPPSNSGDQDCLQLPTTQAQRECQQTEGLDMNHPPGDAGQAPPNLSAR